MAGPLPEYLEGIEWLHATAEEMADEYDNLDAEQALDVLTWLMARDWIPTGLGDATKLGWAHRSVAKVAADPENSGVQLEAWKQRRTGDDLMVLAITMPPTIE
jgi:hypothetical protein